MARWYSTPSESSLPIRVPRRFMCTAARAETVARFREVRIEQRGQHLKDGLLDQPIPDRRDSQRSLSAP